MVIAFDVDGCLFEDGQPVKANVELLKILAGKHKVIVWSGNGYEYAYDKAKKMGIESIICGVLNKYGNFRPDIAFDDKEIDLGKVNIQI